MPLEGFSAQMFIWRNELYVTTKLSAERENPAITNDLLTAAILNYLNFRSIFNYLFCLYVMLQFF